MNKFFLKLEVLLERLKRTKETQPPTTVLNLDWLLFGRNLVIKDILRLEEFKYRLYSRYCYEININFFRTDNSTVILWKIILMLRRHALKYLGVKCQEANQFEVVERKIRIE